MKKDEDQLSEMYELNYEEALRYSLSAASVEIRATYEWVPAIEEELARQGTRGEAVGNPSRTGPGWMVTVDAGFLPFIGVVRDTPLDLNYVEALCALTATLEKAHQYVVITFKDSWIRNRSHLIHGSEETFFYALSMELSEGPMMLHEKLAEDPLFLLSQPGTA